MVDGLPEIELKVVTSGTETAFPADQHDWAQFVYPLTGVIELTVGRALYSAPPEFGIWLPPRVDHQAWANDDSKYVVVNIPTDLCITLPAKACVLSVTPIGRAILTEAAGNGLPIGPMDTAEALRLLMVLVDQLRRGTDLNLHFPLSEDRMLKPVLAGLQVNPGDNRSLGQWAERVGCTERTLARRFKGELGMTFVEWRQRLRLSRAISLLATDMTVQTIAHKLGYGSSSTFIRMFRETTDFTPQHFRRRMSDPNEDAPEIDERPSVQK